MLINLISTFNAIFTTFVCCWAFFFAFKHTIRSEIFHERTFSNVNVEHCIRWLAERAISRGGISQSNIKKKKKFRSLLQFMSKRHREKWNFIVFPTVKYIISNYAIPVVLRHCADWMKKLLFLFQLYFLSLSLLSFLFKLQSSTTFIFTRNKTIKSNPKMNCKMLFRVWKTTKRKKKIHTQKKMS